MPSVMALTRLNETNISEHLLYLFRREDSNFLVQGSDGKPNLDQQVRYQKIFYHCVGVASCYGLFDGNCTFSCLESGPVYQPLRFDVKSSKVSPKDHQLPVIDFVLTCCQKYDTNALVKDTHEDGAAWSIAKLETEDKDETATFNTKQLVEYYPATDIEYELIFECAENFPEFNVQV